MRSEARQYCHKAVKELALDTGSLRERLARARPEFSYLMDNAKARDSLTTSERDYLDAIVGVDGRDAVMALNDDLAERMALDMWLLYDGLSDTGSGYDE